jgi:hypothetical protein
MQVLAVILIACGLAALIFRRFHFNFYSIVTFWFHQCEANIVSYFPLKASIYEQVPLCFLKVLLLFILSAYS